MWIASKTGFYSIVKSKNSDEWLVRSRSKEDLTGLIEQLCWGNKKVLQTFDADYFFRIIVDQDELFCLMEFLTNSIDYRNFKAMIDKNPEQKDKHDSYVEVWHAMFNYQLKKYREKYYSFWDDKDFWNYRPNTQNRKRRKRF